MPRNQIGYSGIQATVPICADKDERVSTELPHRGQSAAPRPLRVVLAEDADMLREMWRRLLAAAGVSVRVARDGEQALALIEEATPDVLVTDVGMPIMDGFELLECVRERWPELPVIVISGEDVDEQRQRATQLGAAGYLVKTNFSTAQLLQVIERSSPARE